MNGYTRDIAALLKITLELAVQVQDRMISNGVDFSECSTRAFNKEAKLAFAELFATA